jgi:acyl-CoA thioester hydrolase
MPAMTDAKSNPTLAQSGSHRLTLRVYYEDTDFSGRVYHASYLRFLERGRTEWLRAQGFEQRELADGAALVFAVRRIEIDYLRAGLMDDLFAIETRVAAVGGASIEFAQAVLRGDETVVRAIVGVVALSNGRPMRLPRDMRERFSAPQPHPNGDPAGASKPRPPGWRASRDLPPDV